MSSRVYLVRHGETEWSQGGKHTSTSEIPLTASGEDQVRETSKAYVGVGKLIDPTKIARIYCSPRGRARRTTELLKLGTHEHQHFHFRESNTLDLTIGDENMRTIQVTPLLQEWDYGDYEGLSIQDVHRIRKEKGQDDGRNWNIWEDGCPGGESPQEVSDRLDKLIKEIREVIESQAAEWPGGQKVRHHESATKDIVCVAHGHILAALALRWAQQPLRNGMRLLNEPCGVAVLGFEHDDFQEPAIILGRRPGH